MGQLVFVVDGDGCVVFYGLFYVVDVDVVVEYSVGVLIFKGYWGIGEGYECCVGQVVV